MSSDGIVVAHNKELKEYLKPGDIKLVQETWNLLQDDLEHIGLIMFQRYVYYHVTIGLLKSR